jgi:hypothetical protein
MRTGFKTIARMIGQRAWLGLIASLFLWATSAHGQTVSTIAGAFEGFVDGDNQVSQFHTPTSLALDGLGHLFVSDLGNNAIRVLRLSDNVVSTFTSGLAQPVALAFDLNTNLFVVQQGNGTLIRFDAFGNFRGTVIGGLAQPQAVTTDASGNVYVAESAGVVRRINTNGFVTGVYRTLGRSSAFRGVATTQEGRLVVSDAGVHVLWIFDGPGDNPRLLAGTINNIGFADGVPGIAKFYQPHQIARGPNNSIVVADRFNHRVRLVSCDGITRTLFGVDPSAWGTAPDDFPGWFDGPASVVESREPYGVAVASDGTVYDSEVYYHLVRAGTGFVFPPLCGGDTNTTGTNVVVPVPILTPNSGFFPNDVTVQITASNAPGFGPDVKLFYTLDGTEPTVNSPQVPIINGVGILRLPGPIDLASLKVKAFLGTASSPTVSAQPTVVPVPILTPNSGYYPMGVRISVTSTNGFPEGTLLFYTLNGTEPTTNSLPVEGVGNNRFITVRDSTIDLRSVRVKAFLGPNVGNTVSGQAVSFANLSIGGEVGIPAGINNNTFFAGIGSTIVIPVVANMKQGQSLRSLVFVAEVVAKGGAPRLENKAQLRFLPISTNDFVPVIAATTNTPTTLFSTINGPTNKLAVGFVGPSSGFAVTNFAAVAMLAVEIRPGPDSVGNQASEGDEYTIRISQISGTSDGVQTIVPLAAMAERTIQIKNIQYLVGDTSPGYWYNAGDFGNGALDNGDINNAVFASFGFHVPYDFTDVFDAMDAYPPDTETQVGGDGQIRFLDWQTILQRAVGFDPNNWFRIHTQDPGPEGRYLRALRATLAQQSLRRQSISIDSSTDSLAWDKQVILSSGVLENMWQGGSVSLPVIAKIQKGKTLSGMQFVAYVTGANGDPVVQPITFKAAPGIPAPTTGNVVPGVGTLKNGVFCTWNVGDFSPELSGTVTLGSVDFMMPANALSGHHYELYFEHADGAAGGTLQTSSQLDFDSLRGAVWINSSAATLPDNVSDEWKAHFFGRKDAPQAVGASDPDQDGLTNYEEYITGSDPTHADWRFRATAGVFTFRWAGETGVNYTIERSSDLKSWTPVGTHIPGADAFIEFKEDTGSSRTFFYQVRKEN